MGPFGRLLLLFVATVVVTCFPWPCRASVDLTGTWIDTKSNATIHIREIITSVEGAGGEENSNLALEATCAATPCWSKVTGKRSADGAGGLLDLTFEYTKEDRITMIPNIYARVSGCGGRIEFFGNNALWVRDPLRHRPSYSPTIAHVGTHHEIKQCKHGTFILNHYDTWVSRSLKLYGEWSEFELSIFLQILRPGDVAIDIGANVGAFTVPMAKRVGLEGLVYAFEPQRFLSQTLSANVVLNELPNVYTMHMALGDHIGTIRVPRVMYSSPGNFGALSLLKKYPATRPLPLMTLDSLRLPCPRFIKVDAEGMEENILEGAVKTIQKCKPFLYVENNCVMGSKNLILAIHRMGGYRLYWDVQPYYNNKNFFGDSSNIFPDAMMSINMLAIHDDSQEGNPFRDMSSWVRIDVEQERFLLSEYVLWSADGHQIRLRQNGNETFCKR